MISSERLEFWRKHYRVRINGKWHGGGKYSLFTRREVFDMILKGEI
jgi:hypothetical protein